jgi:pimeloyl-ACP methyl ester carboxylesterase
MPFLGVFENWPLFQDLWLRRLFGDESRIPPDSFEGYRIPILKNHVFRHALRIVKSWTPDLAVLEATLPRIRDYPTLLMWGTRDHAVDFQSAERLRRNFRDAGLVVLEGIGHLPYEEAPEDFNRALIEFLTSSVVSVEKGGLD